MDELPEFSSKKLKN